MLKQLTYTLIDDVDSLIDMIEAYTARPEVPVAFDTETTGLSPIEDKLVSLQFMQFGYLPVLVDVRHWPRSEMKRAGRALHSLFAACKIVGMNLSFDYKMVRAKMGVSIQRAYDIMLVEQVLYGLGKTGGRAKGIEFNLKSIAARYGVPVSKEERTIFIGMDKNPDLWDRPFDVRTMLYMAQDVEVLEEIYRLQVPKVAESKLGHVVNLENRALPAVASIEFNGIHVNEAGWRKIIEEKAALAVSLEQEAITVFGGAIIRVRARRFKRAMNAYKQWQSDLEDELSRCKHAFEATGAEKGWGEFKKNYMSQFRELYPNPGNPKLETHVTEDQWGETERSLAESRNLCYEPINLGSVKQMLEAFKELGIPLTSTAKEALDELPEGMYPEVDLLRRWREAQMFPVKFGENLLSQINKQTLRIYPQIHQIGADTGRMSVSNPPWQQIPSKTIDGKRLRACVTAREGSVLLTADYPNIELRILADLSGDRTMLKLFADGVDLHTATAKMMFGLPDTFDPKNDRHPGSGVLYRSIAKTINFGLVYGMSAAKLARTLKISKEQAQELMDAYFTLYPGVVQWLKRQRALGTSQMYSTTVSGRKRFYTLPDRYSPGARSAIERRACNSPIQGSSADITKLALALAYERLPEAARIVAVVHDEIVVEAPIDLKDQCAAILAEAMKASCLKYLKRVHIPEFEVSISDHWEKD